VGGFFDNLAHGWLRRILKQRINDEGLLRLAGKWLNAGVMEDGADRVSEAGAAQPLGLWERHIRFSRIYPLLGEIAPRGLGAETAYGQEAADTEHESRVGLVSGPPPPPAGRAIPCAVQQAAGELSVLRRSLELRTAEGGAPERRERLAVLAEPA
jgi:hypothetical protein